MDNAQGSAGSVHAFWCNICKVACASAVNLQTHFLGSKHKMLEKALKAHGIVKTMGSEPAGPGKVPDCAITEADSSSARTLGEQLDGCRSTEPAVGLEYLFEYRSQGSHMYYECVLCGCEAGLTNMFMHVVGAKHRLAYLTKHHPELAEVTGRGSELHKKLKLLAAQVEAQDGRKKITVVTDEQQLKRKYGVGDDDDLGPYKTKRIDFTSDDFCVEPTAPPAAQNPTPGPSPSYQELKRAHAEATKKQQQQVPEKDDGFGSKKELLEYLRQFQITCEDDATFVLKVTQSFTQTLVKYREKAKAKAEEATAPPENATQPPTDVRPVTGQNIYTEYPPKKPAGQTSTVPPYNAKAAGTNPTSNDPVLNKTPTVSSAPQNPSNVGPAAMNTPAPQGFPGGALGSLQETNKATIEFFTSIKNMDAEEVSATLRKIAATNPAFKGIDIPNVIKILSESGSLKSSTTGKKAL
ncbi:hypothetical protein NDU88_003628 [Pleurodeles waltl]|uniref:C2H2-type domain-containing protein n=1 Tax=Pleurodeles waltl TaxID=8319 RepID=A0AAV7VH94_PLEWA|nr:hypothetical protein NDU88_003628 [Pleurodeles waltl]